MTEPQTDEKEIIRSVLSGDRNAFARLVRAHEVRVRSLALSLLRDPTEADDAAQEVFLKAYRNLNTFRGEATFSTWIYRIAYRHCLDMAKARKRRPAESLDALLEKGDGVLKHQEARAISEGAIDARGLLDELPADYRLILVLREGQGLSYDEIAAAMKTSLDGVKARLRRARRTLMEKARHLRGPAVVQRAGEDK